MKIFVSKENPIIINGQIQNFLANSPDGPIKYEDDISAISFDLPEKVYPNFINFLLEVMEEDLY